MDNLTKMGQFFKDRDNIQPDSANSVELINKNPISFKLNNKFFINKDFNNLRITETAYNKVMDNNTLLGTSFIAIPTANGKTWFVIDKEVI